MVSGRTCGRVEGILMPSVEGLADPSADSTPLMHLKEIVFMPFTISSTSVCVWCEEKIMDQGWYGGVRGRTTGG